MMNDFQNTKEIQNRYFTSSIIDGIFYHNSNSPISWSSFGTAGFPVAISPRSR